MKFSQKGNREWKAEETGRGEKNLEKEKETYENKHVYCFWYFLKVYIF